MWCLHLIYSLLDEVESLTAARAGALAGTEPSDGLRVSKHLSYGDEHKFEDPRL